MTRYDRYGLSSEQQKQGSPAEAVKQQQEQKETDCCATMTDEESILLERANSERNEIFNRYDQGHMCEDIGAWENPLFEVYTQADRYGFLHTAKLAPTKESEIHQHKLEMERVKKWLKMHNNWDSAATKENLRRRVMKGIPERMRSVIWRKLLDLGRIAQENPGVYGRMLECARQRSPDIRQIDFDVNRQFRNHVFYRERYSVKQQSLFRVLAAYSMYNTDIGYCQGMSTVAAVLLMYFDEEDTFWALDVLMSNTRYAMHGLYIVGFPKLMRILAHHDKILTKCLPKLKKHLDKHEVHSVLYSLKWFFVIFIERIPFTLCLRVWDIYMMFGERVLTAMAYTILKIHKKELCRMKDMDELTDFLQTKLHREFGYDDDYVIKVLKNSMDELKRMKLLNLPPAAPNEFPTMPRGQSAEPSAKARIGHRNEHFSEREMKLKETVLYRSESKNEEDQEQYNNGDVRDTDDRATVAEDEDDERTEKDYDDITDETTSQLHTGLQRLPKHSPLAKVSDMDGASITKHSFTGTSVTSTNDISLTSYDRSCDIFRLHPSGQHPTSRDHLPAGTTSAVLLLDQLAAQLSDEELSSYGAAVDLVLDEEDSNPDIRSTIIQTPGEDHSFAQQELLVELEVRSPSPSPVEFVPIPQPNDEEDDDEVTEKQLSF